MNRNIWTNKVVDRFRARVEFVGVVLLSVFFDIFNWKKEDNKKRKK